MDDLPILTKGELRSLRSLEAQAQNLLERTHSLDARIQARVTGHLGLPLLTRLTSLPESNPCWEAIEFAQSQALCAQQAFSDALYEAKSDG